MAPDPRDVQDSHPGRVVARLARHVTRGLHEVDLSDSQYRLLAFLSEGEAAASALAGRLAVTRPSVTALVDGLVTRGLVQRCADPGDRRRVGHVLTPAGRAVLVDADSAVEARLLEVAAHMTDDQRQPSMQALGHWGVALRAWREAQG